MLQLGFLHTRGRKSGTSARKVGFLTIAGAVVMVLPLAYALFNLDRADEVIPNGIFTVWFSAFIAGVIMILTGSLTNRRK